MALTNRYRFGEFTLDIAQRRLERRDEVVPLQPRVFEVLHYLVEHSDRVVPKTELLAAVWPETFVTENALARCVRQIRSALGDDARAPSFLRTAQRVGYQFIADTRSDDTPSEAAQRRRSVLVLPFKLLGGEPADALEMGMADTLITRLSGLYQLIVRPLSTARRYADLVAEPVQAGAEQGVDLVIDGSLQLSGETLRVTARLTRVRGAIVLWADRLDRRIEDVFAVQDSICEHIAEALGMTLTGREHRGLAKRHTTDTRAYRAYSLGRFYFGKHTPTATHESIQQFEQAIDLDPTYALAHVGLAEAFESLGTLGLRPLEHYEKMRSAAARAYALDDDLADPLRCLAKIAWQWDREWDEADRLFRRAIQLEPNNPETRVAYSDFCCYMRRTDQGEAEARKAIELDPVSPWVNTMLAQALYLGGKYAEASGRAKDALAIDPDFGFAHLFAGLAALHGKRPDEGVARLEAAWSASARLDFAGALGLGYTLTGQEDRARKLLAELGTRAGEEPVPAVAFAVIHMGLGEHDRAFEFLEQCFEERSWHVLLVYADPILHRLRSDPRSADLFRRLGLPTLDED